MGKFTKTIHFTIFIKLFFINYPYLGAEDEENCCKNLCPCFYQSEISKSDIDDEEENSNNTKDNNLSEGRQIQITIVADNKFSQKLIEEKKKLEEENENLKQGKRTLEEEIKKLGEENVKLKQEGNLEEEKKKLVEEQGKLEEEKKKIEGKENDLENKKIKLNQKEKDLANETNTLQNERKLLIDKNNKIEEEKKKLKQKEKNFQDEIIKLKEKENSLINEKKNLELEKKAFQKEKDRFALSKLPTLIGLRNIGATCYMNATLQALSNTDALTEYFLTKYHSDPSNNSKRMSNEMYKVLCNLWDENKKKGDYPPSDFKNSLSEENPLFAGIAANDSKDLINFLLERFHQELNTVDKNNININGDENVNQMDEMQTFSAFLKEYFQLNQSIIVDTFYGICETKSKCVGCNITKYNFQIYSFLEFPLKEVNSYMFQLGRRFALVNNDGTNPDINLYECFDYYQKVDLMTGQNQMYCNICNMNTNTYYGTTVYSLPNYLIINLNRGKGATYKCNVIFPEVLNLLNYVSFKEGTTAMRLYAVICHYGPSSMSGHFIAYCRHRVTNKWYKYNDSIVTECTQPKEYTNGMPYILFYKAV